MTNGLPNESGKLVTRMKIGPRLRQPVLVRRLGRAGAASGILAAGSKADDTSGYGQHPEHADDARSVSSSAENPTDDDHDCCDDNGGFTSEVVAGQSDCELSDDFADKQSVRNACRPGGCVLFLVLGRQNDIGHCPENHSVPNRWTIVPGISRLLDIFDARHSHETVLVAIADQRGPSSKDGENIAQALFLRRHLSRWRIGVVRAGDLLDSARDLLRRHNALFAGAIVLRDGTVAFGHFDDEGDSRVFRCKLPRTTDVQTRARAYTYVCWRWHTATENHFGHRRRTAVSIRVQGSESRRFLTGLTQT